MDFCIYVESAYGCTNYCVSEIKKYYYYYYYDIKSVS